MESLSSCSILTVLTLGALCLSLLVPGSLGACLVLRILASAAAVRILP
jgi:hypothetical protein